MNTQRERRSSLSTQPRLKTSTRKTRSSERTSRTMQASKELSRGECTCTVKGQSANRASMAKLSPKSLSRRWLVFASFAFVLLLGLMTQRLVFASPLGSSAALGVGGEQTLESANQPAGGYNNFENLIFDILDDAGDRLKKSKANGARQVKHTLRFGRSGVWVAPTFEQLAEESLANGRLGYTYTN